MISHNERVKPSIHGQESGILHCLQNDKSGAVVSNRLAQWRAGGVRVTAQVAASTIGESGSGLWRDKELLHQIIVNAHAAQDEIATFHLGEALPEEQPARGLTGLDKEPGYSPRASLLFQPVVQCGCHSGADYFRVTVQVVDVPVQFEVSVCNRFVGFVDRDQ